MDIYQADGGAAEAATLAEDTAATGASASTAAVGTADALTPPPRLHLTLSDTASELLRVEVKLGAQGGIVQHDLGHVELQKENCQYRAPTSDHCFDTLSENVLKLQTALRERGKRGSRGKKLSFESAFHCICGDDAAKWFVHDFVRDLHEKGAVRCAVHDTKSIKLHKHICCCVVRRCM